MGHKLQPPFRNQWHKFTRYTKCQHYVQHFWSCPYPQFPIWILSGMAHWCYVSYPFPIVSHGVSTSFTKFCLYNFSLGVSTVLFDEKVLPGISTDLPSKWCDMEQSYLFHGNSLNSYISRCLWLRSVTEGLSGVSSDLPSSGTTWNSHTFSMETHWTAMSQGVCDLDGSLKVSATPTPEFSECLLNLQPSLFT